MRDINDVGNNNDQWTQNLVPDNELWSIAPFSLLPI